jgi:hypothetical protein
MQSKHWQPELDHVVRATAHLPAQSRGDVYGQVFLKAVKDRPKLQKLKNFARREYLRRNRVIHRESKSGWKVVPIERADQLPDKRCTDPAANMIHNEAASKLSWLDQQILIFKTEHFLTEAEISKEIRQSRDFVARRVRAIREILGRQK